jgi:hypothetical protein
LYVNDLLSRIGYKAPALDHFPTNALTGKPKRFANARI